MLALGIGLAGPATLAHAADQRQAAAQAQETDQRQAQAKSKGQDLGAVPGEGAVAGIVAKWLGEKIAGAAVGKAFNWIVDAIAGSPGSAEQLALLNEINTKLDEIKKQLDYVTLKLDALTADLHKTSLDSDIKQLQSWSADVTNFYKFSFSPMVERAKELNEAKMSGGDVAAAQQKLEEAQATFVIKYTLGEATYSPLGPKIHNYLLPGAASSMLENKGRVLLDANRYLTVQDSMDLRDLYTAYAEQEALATWMKAEYYRAIKDDLNLQQTMDDYQADTAAEVKNLAPMIPADAILDVGKKQSASTNNATMWIPSTSDRLTYRPGAGGGVEDALAALNTQPGMKNWKVPLQVANPADPTFPNMAALVGGPGGYDAKANKNQLSNFLRSLNPKNDRWKGISDNWNMFYTSAQVSQKVECYHYGWPFNVHINRVWPRFNTYVALYNKGLGATPAPVLPSERVIPKEEPTTQACQQFGDSYFYANDGVLDPLDDRRRIFNEGAFLAGRDTGMMAQDYMAQGAATVSLKAVKRAGKLRVNVNPNRKGAKNWKFTVKRFKNSKWKKVKHYSTKGRKEIRTINLRKGRYRVHIKPKTGLAGGFTRPVKLKR